MKKKEALAIEFAEADVNPKVNDMHRYQALIDGYMKGFDMCKEMIEDLILSKRIAKGISRVTVDDIKIIGEEFILVYKPEVADKIR